jgi:hypothetical protein
VCNHLQLSTSEAGHTGYVRLEFILSWQEADAALRASSLNVILYEPCFMLVLRTF